jgi:hypothetical protein
VGPPAKEVLVRAFSRAFRRPRTALPAAVFAAIIGAWLIGAAAGLGGLASYSTIGSVSTSAPDRWPDGTALARPAGVASLVVFLHPRCPCSAATLGELGRVLARAPGSCEVTVAVYAPASEPTAWNHTFLRDRALAVPGVRVVDDPDGREAARFGAVRSGHVVVYDAAGGLRFQGGITASRGHEGDNLGEDCVLSVLHGGAPAADRTPTFGCEIRTAAPDAACPLCTQEAAR